MFVKGKDIIIGEFIKVTYITPKVELISYPSNVKKILYTAMRTCYSSTKPFDLFLKEIDEEKMLALINKIIESGHTSTIEHVQFVFSISGISRACSHQLVRSRHLQYSQKSQRYVIGDGNDYPEYLKNFEYIVPSKIIENQEISKEYDELMEQIKAFYNKMVANNIPAEDARMILPNATETSLVLSGNLRAIKNFMGLRLCMHAQDEIRYLANEIKKEIVKVEPWTNNILVPNCKFCTDHRPCIRKAK